MNNLLLFGRKNEPKNKLEVDLGDLKDIKENITDFLQTHLKTTVYQGKNKVMVDADNVKQPDLFHSVKKFIYHRSLNNTHWASSGVSVVKINQFKGHKKDKESKKKESQTQSEVQTWGL